MPASVSPRARQDSGLVRDRKVPWRGGSQWPPRASQTRLGGSSSSFLQPPGARHTQHSSRHGAQLAALWEHPGASPGEGRREARPQGAAPKTTVIRPDAEGQGGAEEVPTKGRRAGPCGDLSWGGLALFLSPSAPVLPSLSPSSILRKPPAPARGDPGGGGGLSSHLRQGRPGPASVGHPPEHQPPLGTRSLAHAEPVQSHLSLPESPRDGCAEPGENSPWPLSHPAPQLPRLCRDNLCVPSPH